MTYSSYQLKYCERCGGLGLRRDDSASSYCRPCEQMLQNFLLSAPPSTPHKYPSPRTQRPPVNLAKLAGMAVEIQEVSYV